MQGAAIVRFTPELSQWDPGDVRANGARRLAARRRSLGRRELPVRPRSRRQLLAAARRSARRYGFKAEKIDPVRYKDFVVSSTRIRRLIGEGRVDEAGRAARPSVLRRRHRSCTATAAARTIGFPTANLCTDNELLPPHGVYATTTTIDGVVRPSVTNIGVRPTVDASGRVTIETHVFDFDEDLYGAPLRVGFVQRLRDERAFESLDALRAQIAADCDRARVLFDRLSL